MARSTQLLRALVDVLYLDGLEMSRNKTVDQIDVSGELHRNASWRVEPDKGGSNSRASAHFRCDCHVDVSLLKLWRGLLIEGIEGSSSSSNVKLVSSIATSSSSSYHAHAISIPETFTKQLTKLAVDAFDSGSRFYDGNLALRLSSSQPIRLARDPYNAHQRLNMEVRFRAFAVQSDTVVPWSRFPDIVCSMHIGTLEAAKTAGNTIGSEPHPARSSEIQVLHALVIRVRQCLSAFYGNDAVQSLLIGSTQRARVHADTMSTSTSCSMHFVKDEQAWTLSDSTEVLLRVQRFRRAGKGGTRRGHLTRDDVYVQSSRSFDTRSEAEHSKRMFKFQRRTGNVRSSLQMDDN